MANKLVYRELKGYKYDLCCEVRWPVPELAEVPHFYNGYLSLVGGELRIKEGYAWDGPSGPTIDTKTFMRGSLIHDALYQLMREGALLPAAHRKYADELLRVVCLMDGMSKFRAWYVYKIIRVAGRYTCTPRKKPRGKVVTI